MGGAHLPSGGLQLAEQLTLLLWLRHDGWSKSFQQLACGLERLRSGAHAHHHEQPLAKFGEGVALQTARILAAVQLHGKGAHAGSELRLVQAVHAEQIFAHGIDAHRNLQIT